MNTKTCITCKKEKKIEYFYYSVQNKDRRNNSCKECVSKASKKRYGENRISSKNYRERVYINHESLGNYLRVHIKRAFDFKIFHKLTSKERVLIVKRIDEVLKGYEGK